MCTISAFLTKWQFQKKAVAHLKRTRSLKRWRPRNIDEHTDRHLLVVADDSGLEVAALGGAPGILSARYAGEHASDKENIDKLLSELARTNVPLDQRSARFRCVIALARKGKLLGKFEGIVEGSVVELPRGSGGFGYDPIFLPNGFDKTFGESPIELKNQISHRAERFARSVLDYRPLSAAIRAWEAVERRRPEHPEQLRL